MQTIRTIAENLIFFINDIVVPLLFAVAFVVFTWGVFKYFILDTEGKDRAKGRSFIIYGIVGFAIMISLWGLVRVLVGTFGFDTTSRPCVPTFSGQGCAPAGTSGPRATTPPAPAPAQQGATPPRPESNPGTLPPGRLGPP